MKKKVESKESFSIKVWQWCNDVSDTGLIKNNVVIP